MAIQLNISSSFDNEQLNIKKKIKKVLNENRCLIYFDTNKDMEMENYILKEKKESQEFIKIELNLDHSLEDIQNINNDYIRNNMNIFAKYHIPEFEESFLGFNNKIFYITFTSLENNKSNRENLGNIILILLKTISLKQMYFLPKDRNNVNIILMDLSYIVDGISDILAQSRSLNFSIDMYVYCLELLYKYNELETKRIMGNSIVRIKK